MKVYFYIGLSVLSILSGCSNISEKPKPRIAISSCTDLNHPKNEFLKDKFVECQSRNNVNFQTIYQSELRKNKNLEVEFTRSVCVDNLGKVESVKKTSEEIDSKLTLMMSAYLKYIIYPQSRDGGCFLQKFEFKLNEYENIPLAHSENLRNHHFEHKLANNAMYGMPHNGGRYASGVCI